MKIKKLLLPITGILTIVPVMATAISCTTSWDYERGEGNDLSYIKKDFATTPEEKKNVMSSYFNATDMLATLGYYPDYASKSSGGTIYSDYLKPLLGDNNTTISNGVVKTGKYNIKPAPRIMDGEVVDREALYKADISTILLNEWEKVDEAKFHNVIPAIIYTSMADGYARINKNDDAIYDQTIYDKFYNTDNTKDKTYGLDTYEAFEMLTKGLDRAYPDNNFLAKAKKVNKQVKANVKTLSDTLKINKGKTIIVLDVKVDSGKVVIDQIRGTGVYSILYSTIEGMGLGYQFPSPKNVGNLAMTGSGIKALDKASLIDEFAQTADEVIVLNNPQNTLEVQEIINNKSKDVVKSLLKLTASAANNIKILNRNNFYDTVWGVYGLNEFLKHFAKAYENTNTALKTLDFNNIDEFKPTKTKAIEIKLCTEN